jgi:heme-degrading monooxygenase HmoA
VAVVTAEDPPKPDTPIRSIWEAVGMIVVTEHRAGDEFLGPARDLLTRLAVADGFLDGYVGRSPDEPDTWLISTRWRDVGSMRRGFGTFEAKVAAAAVMTSATDRISAFEVLLAASQDGIEQRRSDRA